MDKEIYQPKYSNETYLRYDPYEGDMDSEVSFLKIKICHTRKPHLCDFEKRHIIPTGMLTRVDVYVLDGTWHRQRFCAQCMDRWLLQAGG